MKDKPLLLVLGSLEGGYGTIELTGEVPGDQGHWIYCELKRPETQEELDKLKRELSPLKKDDFYQVRVGDVSSNGPGRSSRFRNCTFLGLPSTVASPNAAGANPPQ